MYCVHSNPELHLSPVKMIPKEKKHTKETWSVSNAKNFMFQNLIRMSTIRDTQIPTITVSSSQTIQKIASWIKFLPYFRRILCLGKILSNFKIDP